MHTSEVLNTAADLIEKRGWITGTGWPNGHESTSLCLEGGIAAAVGIGNYYALTNEEVDDFEHCPAFQSVQSYLDCEGRPLYSWNDGQTSAGVVIEVLRSAALIESSREQDAAWQSYATNVASA